MSNRALPTTRQLHYFVALVKHRHFAKAAAACFVSPSAFSSAIKDLETLLDLRLVDRTNKSVTITPLGQTLADQAQRCLNELGTLVELARGSREPLAGPLRLGVIPTIAPFLLPRLLPQLRRSHPRLKLYLVEEQSQPLYERLMAGELDLLLLALPYPLRHVETLPLFRDPFRLACRKGSPLRAIAQQSLQQLPEESLLLLEDGHCLRDHALAACAIRDLNQVNRFAASSLLTLVEMVDADLGITFLPQMAEGSVLLKNTRVETYPLDEQGYREIGLVWRQGSDRSSEFRLLGEIITAHHG